jgi:hypothetical protein
VGVERMIANKKIWQFVRKQEENSRPPVAKVVCTILCLHNTPTFTRANNCFIHIYPFE